MSHIVETQWIGGMQFNAAINGHTIIMDAPERAGGNDTGTIPKPLVLAALTGCTGMDVVALLRKAGKGVDDFSVRAEGVLGARPPLEYVAAHLVYEFRGAQENREAALDAVSKSQEQFCGVSRMLKRIMPITWEIWFNGEKVFSNAVAADSDVT